MSSAGTFSRRRFIGAAAGVAGAAALSPQSAVATGGDRGGGPPRRSRSRSRPKCRDSRSDRPAAMVHPRRHHAPRRLSERVSGRSRVPVRPDRPGSRGAPARRLRVGVPLPRLGRLPRLRVLQLQPGRQRGDHDGAAPERPRPRRARCGRQPYGRPAVHDRSRLPADRNRPRTGARVPDDRYRGQSRTGLAALGAAHRLAALGATGQRGRRRA